MTIMKLATARDQFAAVPPDTPPLQGVRWPVSPSSLAALIDLGLSDGQIAFYFSINANRVRSLRNWYGL